MKKLSVILIAIFGILSLEVKAETIAVECYGCKTIEMTKRALTYVIDNEIEELKLYMLASYRNGNCIPLRKNDKVELIDTSIMNKMIKIRKIGDWQEYWMFYEFIDKNSLFE
ncbi:MAG: hypothetical protein ACTSYH_03680 [Candidatus Heimdallarchaeaceae archaeon]